MTLSEAKDILVKRVGWRDDKTVEGFLLDATNSESVSGLYFQSEHSAITLKNIRDCQPIVAINVDDFNEYLTNLKEQCVLQVLNDAFEKDFINDNLFALYPTGFDSAISLRMVIIVSELIMTTTRNNNYEKYGKDFVGKLNYDLYRDAPNKFAINSANYNNTLGISTRYQFQIQSVQRRYGQERNLLKTITKGQVFGCNIRDNECDC